MRLHVRRRAAGLGLSVVALMSVGCVTTQQARYVYQDGEFGVIGIPENTDRWPTFYRRQAETLMAAHFPEGHEIVRAEEVAAGSRTRTQQGSHTAEVSPQLPLALIQAIKLGGTSSTSLADTTTLKEARIIYHRRRAPGAEATAFAAEPELAPKPYLDPNAAERAKSELAANGANAEKPEPPAKPGSGSTPHTVARPTPDAPAAASKSTPATPG